jgi:nudix-type nucleoside diphosphatase (YffH/AdpP family)
MSGEEALREVLIERERRVFDDFLKIDEAVLRYRKYDGTLSEPLRRLKLERGDSVGILVLQRETGEVLLVEQFKYPARGSGDGWIVEVVAGVVEGEQPDEAARREVREEIGYEPIHLERIASFFVSPGGTSERIFLYYAEVEEASRVGAGGGLVEEGEDIRLIRLPQHEAWNAIDLDEVRDAKTLIALMWLRRRNETSAQ